MFHCDIQSWSSILFNSRKKVLTSSINETDAFSFVFLLAITNILIRKFEPEMEKLDIQYYSSSNNKQQNYAFFSKEGVHF